VPVPARNTALPTAASRPAAMAAAHRRLTALNTHVTSLLSPAAAAPHNFHPVGASSSPTTAAAAADASLPRVGIVGLGGRGTGTLNTIEESELLQSKMNLVALCDIDPAALAPHAEKLGLTLFSDASELIQSGLIDTLLIITCETVLTVFFSVFVFKREATLGCQDTLRFGQMSTGMERHGGCFIARTGRTTTTPRSESKPSQRGCTCSQRSQFQVRKRASF
jgi:hypothetical protein